MVDSSPFLLSAFVAPALALSKSTHGGRIALLPTSVRRDRTTAELMAAAEST